MNQLLTFKRCVGESPPAYGGRLAFSAVSPDYPGTCYMHYELKHAAHVVGFASYAHARTAATRAIFSNELDFQNVLITASPGQAPAPIYPNATAWFDCHVTQHQ